MTSPQMSNEANVKAMERAKQQSEYRIRESVEGVNKKSKGWYKNFIKSGIKLCKREVYKKSQRALEGLLNIKPN